MSELEGHIDDGHVGGYRYGTALTNVKSVRSLRSPFATIKDAKKKEKLEKKVEEEKEKQKEKIKKEEPEEEKVIEKENNFRNN